MKWIIKNKGIYRAILFIIILTTALLIGVIRLLDNENESPSIQHGVLDLSNWNEKQNGLISLCGEWEFYWQKLLSHDDLTYANIKPDLLSKVPEVWNNYRIDGKSLPGQGYATYRLHVITGLPAGTGLGLKAYSFSSAYSLYIDGELVAANGKVSTDRSGETGEYRPQAVYFKTTAKEFDIIVQVSNFNYARGGFWNNLYLGSPKAIALFNDHSTAEETFIIGVLVITAALFLTVFILVRSQKYSLYFALLCLIIAIVLDMAGQFALFSYFPGISLKLVIFIWYSSFLWVAYFALLYFHELYRSRFSLISVRIYPVVAALFQIIFIFTDTAFYTQYVYLLDYFVITGAICSLIIVLIGAKKNNRAGWINITSMGILLISYVHDDLYWTNIIQSSFGETIYIGLFLFIFLQIVIQARRIREYYDQKAAAELAFLQAQIKPHFLYNAINTFVSISCYDVEQAKRLLIDFSNYLRHSFDFKDLSQLTPLKNELEFVKAYLEIEKARFEERIEVVYYLPDDVETRVPILVLQPIVENAVVHGILPKDEGGRIEIRIERGETALHFMVKDNGVGMEPETKDNIFRRKFGSGVGLLNIDSRLKKLYGKGLQINSTQGYGTEITWCIPLK